MVWAMKPSTLFLVFQLMENNCNTYRYFINNNYVLYFILFVIWDKKRQQLVTHFVRVDMRRNNTCVTDTSIENCWNRHSIIQGQNLSYILRGNLGLHSTSDFNESFSLNFPCMISLDQSGREMRVSCYKNET